MGKLFMKPFVILGFILMLFVKLVEIALVLAPIGLAIVGIFKVKESVNDLKQSDKRID